ncbi:SIMPL domain-containing protein, partial [Klebsiella aerogenes]|uniref:SIMPL domain-containing protein n=1 Tax=Klebsiella aerogenes TaxID=548 RepID=UPI001CBBA8D0
LHMRTKLSIFVLILALALSACGTAAAQPRSLGVSGNGTVYLTPDIAYIYIGVHNEDPVIATAVNNNNTQTQALVDALKNAGIAAV